MPKSCCIPLCTNNSNNKPGITFSIIPLERGRRNKWLHAIGRAAIRTDGTVDKNKTWSPKSNYTYVCQEHFTTGKQSNKIDHPDYVPSIFPAKLNSCNDKDKLKSVDRYNRVHQRQLLKTDPGDKKQPVTKKRLHVEEDESEDIPVPVVRKRLHFSNEIEAQTLTDRLYEEINNLRRERDDIAEKCASNAYNGLSTNCIRDDDEKSITMTGISWNSFMCLFDILAKFISKSRADSIPLIEQFFLTLVKLRQNVTFEFLAFTIGRPKSTIINIFWKWVDLMYAKLKFLIKWPDRENLFQNIPGNFKEKFSRVTSIIDCFETFIEAPRNLKARSQCYSSYKKHCTVKIFIACTPLGSISFISEAWGGKASDIHIVRESGFIDKKYHHPQDQILADRGFTLQEDFALIGAELITPAFTKGKKQLSAYEVEKSRKISSVRIHIERVIGLLKNRYTILKGIIPIRSVQRLSDEANCSGLSSVDKIVHVCAALVNVGTSIVYTDK